VFAGAAVEEGGVFMQIKLGIKDLLSSKPEAAQTNEELPLASPAQSVEAPAQ
jgi:hypothetical protein